MILIYTGKNLYGPDTLEDYYHVLINENATELHGIRETLFFKTLIERKIERLDKVLAQARALKGG